MEPGHKIVCAILIGGLMIWGYIYNSHEKHKYIKEKTKEAIAIFSDALYDNGFTQDQIQTIFTLVDKSQLKIEFDDMGEWDEMHNEISKDYWYNQAR